MKKVQILFGFLCLSFLLVACGGGAPAEPEAAEPETVAEPIEEEEAEVIEEEEAAEEEAEVVEEEPEAEMVEEEEEEPAVDVMEESSTIVDIAVGDEQFSTLVALLTQAGLVETLAGDGPFTVFAPTDDAFAALPEGTLDGLTEEQVVAILTYHVVDGSVLAEQVVTLESATTLQGEDVTINAEDGVMINNATVTAADVEASNGVIHIIDAVLLPPSISGAAEEMAEMSCEDGQRLVEHAGGETCIPEDPQRIAVAGDRHVSETLIAMGIEPIAITNWDEIPDFVQAEFSDFEAVVNLGGNWEPNLEMLVEVEPDLIITHGDDFFDSLSQIAPTVKINSPYEGVEGVVTDVGAIFGDEQTDMLLALLDEAVETVTCAVDNPEEITVSMIDHFNGGIGLNTTIPWNTSAFLIQEVGFAIPDAHIAEEISDLRGLSLERLDTLEEAEVLFVLRYYLDDENPETLLDSPLWQSLEVVQSGNVLDGNFRWWSVGGPLATQRTAEEMVAGLIDFGLATPCEETADEADMEAAGCEAGFRLVEHAGGETCIPEDPQRIAVAGDRHVSETLIAMGIEPVAITNWDEVPDFVQAEFSDFEAVVNLGGNWEPNLELLVEVGPDLIITHGDDFFDSLSQIAPTVKINSPYEGVEGVVADVGAIFGDEQTDMLLALLDEAVETVTCAVDNPEEITVSIIDHWQGGIGLNTTIPWNTSAFLIQEAGFAIPEAHIAEEISDLRGLSLERLDTLEDAEVLFVLRYYLDDESPEMLLDSPLWQSLEVVQSGNVLDGNFRWWSVGGPLATQRAAEEMVAGLIDFGLATPCE